jgi:hypothetical protein
MCYLLFTFFLLYLQFFYFFNNNNNNNQHPVTMKHLLFVISGCALTTITTTVDARPVQIKTVVVKSYGNWTCTFGEQQDAYPKFYDDEREVCTRKGNVDVCGEISHPNNSTSFYNIIDFLSTANDACSFTLPSSCQGNVSVDRISCQTVDSQKILKRVVRSGTCSSSDNNHAEEKHATLFVLDECVGFLSVASYKWEKSTKKAHTLLLTLWVGSGNCGVNGTNVDETVPIEFDLSPGACKDGDDGKSQELIVDAVPAISSASYSIVSHGLVLTGAYLGMMLV